MKSLFLILSLGSFVCLIIGLAKPSAFSRFIKSGVTRKKIGLICGVATFVFFILFVMTAGTDSDKTSNGNQQTGQQEEQTGSELQKQPQKQISYEIVERWSIPNGGEGKAIVISPDYLNETDMVALGEKLKNDTKNDRNAFIYVFTDKKAAALRDKGMLGELSKTDQGFYDKNYVGQYNKNGNTGYHQFAIYFDGVTGTNSKIIEY